MAEEKVFKNVKLDKRGPNWFVDYSPFHENEWDVEIKLTRKVKPIPTGTFAQHLHGAGNYVKTPDGWIYLGHFGAGERRIPSIKQDDEWFYKNTKPLKPGEWD